MPSNAPFAPRSPDERPLQPKILILASGFLLLLAMVSADAQLGSRFGLLLFYLVPIAWVAWQAGQTPALIIAVACAIARFGVKIVEALNDYGIGPELIWSVASELIFFLVFVGLLLTVQRQLEAERALARSDALTKLANARAFEAALTNERERLRRYGRTVSVIYFDLDNFKNVNDRFGHAAGDELLITVGRVVSGGIRQVDVGARLGGDEFALLLPETDAAGAAIVASRLSERIVAAVQARGWPVTTSVGCVTFERAPESVELMMKIADAAMYRAKHGGKNRVEWDVWSGAESNWIDVA